MVLLDLSYDSVENEALFVKNAARFLELCLNTSFRPN